MQTDVKMPNFAKMVGILKDLNKDIDKAIERTISDCKQRGPAQVTKAVTAVYGIKAADVAAAGKAAKGGAKTVGKIKVSGVKIDSVHLMYSGKLLTPTHFSMTPKARPAGGKKYKIKATIIKGQTKVLGTGMFLAPAKGEGTTVIPWKKTPEKRWPVEPVKTVSIPQMIDNEKVHTDIKARMDELLITRLKHHTDRIASKK